MWAKDSAEIYSGELYSLRYLTNVNVNPCVDPTTILSRSISFHSLPLPNLLWPSIWGDELQSALPEFPMSEERKEGG